ncbi:MAG: hypothetical protein ACLRTR_06715 [Clostridia bacterium]|mgnify:FL=1
MKSSLRKMFGMIVICAILLAACGRKDPLNRQTAYFEITEGCGGEVYGVRETYRANTTVTRNQFLDQEEDVVKALKDYIETSLPKEKVGILLYEEMPQEDGYELTVFYQSLVAKEYDKDIDCDIDKCYCLTISVNENENVEIFKLLSLAAK